MRRHLQLEFCEAQQATRTRGHLNEKNAERPTGEVVWLGFTGWRRLVFLGVREVGGRNAEVLKARPFGLGRTRARGSCPLAAASGPVDPLRVAPLRGPL